MNEPASDSRFAAQPLAAAKKLFSKEIVSLLFFACVYWLALQLGFLFVARFEGNAAICPASGVSLAALALTPKSYWKKILAVIFLTNTAGYLWTGGNPPLASLGLALANTVEPFLGAWLLTFFAKPKITFERVAEVFALFGAAFVSAGVAGVLGASISTLAFGVPFTNVFILWWVADGLGILLVAPLIVLWAVGKNTFKFTSFLQTAEVILLIVALTQFAWLVFGPFTNAEKPSLRAYMLFPLLIWVAFKFTPRGMASALAILSYIAVWGTMHDYGMFELAKQSHSEHLIAVQFFLSVATFSGLALSAIVAERKTAQAALTASEEKYRTVADFTYDWEAWRAPNGDYIYVSPSVERITGYAADKFVADTDFMLKITHPEDLAIFNEHLDAIGRHPQETDYQLDFRIVAVNGKTRWINHSCTAVFGEDGRWLGRRESNRDITARKRDEAALRSRLWLSKFADAHTTDELLQNTINEAEALTGSQIGFFHFLNADQKTLELQMWSTNTLQNMCAAEGKGEHYSVDKAGVWVDCVFTRAPVIHNDYARLPASRRKGMPEGHAPVIRELIAPILQNDVIVAIFGVGNKPTDYDEQDVKTVSQLGDMAWGVVLRKRAEEEALRAQKALAQANAELQTALIREKLLSRTDALTGINNRRYLFEMAEREFETARRYQRPLSVLLFDLDYFKKVNDKFGHQIGDQILQLVAQAASAELRSADIIGRYGGEEFVIILPMTDAQQALILAERIRVSVEMIYVPTPKRTAVVTLSVGVAEINHAADESAEDVIRRADEAMYAAKQAGRNCAVIYSPSA